MKTRLRLVKTVAALALIAAAIFVTWVTTRVKAFNPQPDPPAFGLITLNPDQSLRLNVVNRLDTDRMGRATRHAMLGFDLYRMDLRGPFIQAMPGSCLTAHKFADQQSCEVTLMPGEAASFDLAPPADGVVTQVLPSVQDDDRNQHPSLFYTLELREGGKTLYMIPAAQNTWTGR